MTRFHPFIIGASAFALAVTVLPGVMSSPAQAVAIPAPRVDAPAQGLQTAVFAGGCFWGLEGVFEHVRGVRDVVSGYAGGTQAQADYDTVSSGTTRHAEAVRITYDPAQISYGRLLQIYFSVATDPTQLNRQYPDTGPQYRSAIFPQNAGQAGAAKAYIAQLGAAKAWRQPIVTRIESGKFFPAEAHHQDFMRKNPMHPYIVANDAPKVAALKAGFPKLYR